MSRISWSSSTKNLETSGIQVSYLPLRASLGLIDNFFIPVQHLFDHQPSKSITLSLFSSERYNFDAGQPKSTLSDVHFRNICPSWHGGFLRYTYISASYSLRMAFVFSSFLVWLHSRCFKPLSSGAHFDPRRATKISPGALLAQLRSYTSWLLPGQKTPVSIGLGMMDVV